MGGNVFKNPDGEPITTRLPAEDYNLVEQHWFSTLTQLKYKYSVPCVFPDKPSFGDLDILYIEQSDFDIRAAIKQRFNIQNPRHIVVNGPVTSFCFDLALIGQTGFFQVDLIKTNQEFFGSSRFYYSFGDMGCILGILAKHYGLTLGFTGLYIKIRREIFDPNNTLELSDQHENVMLSSAPRDICHYLRYDYNKYLSIEQNPTQELIFNWMISSQLFNEDIVRKLLKDIDTEYSDRLVYRQFVSTILPMYPNAKIKRTHQNEEYMKLHRKQQYETQISAIKHFDKHDEIKIIYEKYRLQKERKEKFDGFMILKELEKKGKKLENAEIGKFINSFKLFCCNSINKDEWDKFIDTQSKEQMLQLISSYVIP